MASAATYTYTCELYKAANWSLQVQSVQGCCILTQVVFGQLITKMVINILNNQHEILVQSWNG
jgi:hypothetical protein